MRIVLIQDFIAPYFSGGSSVYVSDIARGLRELGHDVYIITTKNSLAKSSNFTELRNKGINIVTVDTKLSNIPVYSKKIRRFSRVWSVIMFFFNPFVYRQLIVELKKIQPDVIHIHDSLYLSLSVFRASYRSRVPVFFTCHFTHLIAPQGLTSYTTTGQPKISFFNRLIPSLTRTIIGNPTMVFFLSSFGQKLHQHFSFFTSSNQQLFPTYSRFSHAGFESNKTAETFNLLYSGRLDTEKGIRTLLEAFKLIPNNIQLTICGDGKDRVSLEQEYRNEGRLHFLGLLDTNRLTQQFQNADVVVVPSSIYEMYPLSAVEGISFGKPVIATSIGGTLDIVHHNRNGLLFQPRDFAALSRHIISLASNSALYRKLAEQARCDAIQYSRQNHLQILLAHYQQSIGPATLKTAAI